MSTFRNSPVWRRRVGASILVVALPTLGLVAAPSALAATPPPVTPSSAPAAPTVPAAPSQRPGRPAPDSPAALVGHRHAPVCAAPLPHHVACHAVADLDVSGPLATSTAVPYGYGPADLQAAYALPSATAGTGNTVAVVAAYDLPTAQNDLNTYRTQFGLPACGAGCFTKVNQAGGASPLPAADAGWGQEIALDLDMVSAACPNCNILLVEANSASLSDLGTAVNTAVAMGAVAVSNSYGGTSSTSDASYDASYYDHPGVAITASTGDSGFAGGVNYPAASQYVTAVGGTSLNPDTSTRGFTESAWNGAGSGCAVNDAKPVWQHDTGCPGRTLADVAAVADPYTGVAVYDSTPNGTATGWQVFGGTSASSPLVAGAYALNATPAATATPASFPYARTAHLHDVTTGSTGTCTPTHLCTAGTAYDGPTGLGTPHGVGAFTASPLATGFTATGPTRVLDTRLGLGAPATKLGAGSSTTLTVPKLPVGATGVVLNVTAVNLTGAGGTYISVCPAAQAMATCVQTSMLNPTGTATAANMLTVPVAADGKVQLYNNSGSIDLIADLAGYVTGGFAATGPTRVLDTRYGTGAPASPVAAGTAITLTVPNLPAGTTGVVLNVTATNLTGAGGTYISVCPAAQPLSACVQTSMLNPTGTATAANMLTVPVAADGKVQLYNNSGSIDLIADLAGYFSTALTTTGPTRVLDTRNGTGGPAAQVAAGSAVTLTVPTPLPAGTTGVVLNVTAVNLTGAGGTYISVCPAAQPLLTCVKTSMLNPAGTVTAANMLTVPVAADGKVQLYNNTGSVDLIADLAGYLTNQ